MNIEGPALELLLRRIAETPSDFLAEPRTATQRGLIHVPAVVGDLLALHGHNASWLDQLAPDDTPAARRRASLVLVLCWLLAERTLIAAKPPLEAIALLLNEGAGDLAAHLTPEKYLHDPERREEFVRFSLARLNLRPAGETLAQAQDRLTALSTAERTRVIAAAKKAEQRAREIREALARKAAEESADKYTRE